MKKARRQAATVLYASILVLARCAFADGLAGTSKSAASIQATNLADGKVTFTWEQLAEGTAQITLLNTSKTKHILTLSSWFSASSSGDPSTTIALRSLPEKLEMEPGKYQRTFLTLADPSVMRPRPGTYFAALTFATEAAKDPPLNIQASITVSDPRLGIDKISVLATRPTPWADPWSTKISIPLATSLDASLLPQNKRIVGYLQRSPEGWVKVQWDEVSNDKAPPTATIEVIGLTSAGTYEGDINLPGVAIKASQAALTIIVQDCIVWPIAVIVIGICVAWFAKWYLGVGRNLLKLRRQAMQLSKQLETANSAYKVAAGDAMNPPYSIDASVTNQSENVLTATRQMLTIATSLDGNAAFKATKDHLSLLQGQIEQFPNLGSGGVDLLAVIKAITPSVESSGMSTKMQEEPALVGYAHQLLTGKAIDTADIIPLITKMTNADTTLNAWATLLNHTMELSQNFQECAALHDLSDDERSTLAADEKLLLRIWNRLWAATTNDEIAALTASGSDFESISIDIEQIKEHRSRTESFSTSRSALAGFAAKRQNVLAILSQGSPPVALNVAQDQRQAQVLGVQIALGDLGSIVLALFIAIITGLNYSYWGKAFGTIQDYAVLFLWAAGTKVGVDIITAITDRLASYL